MGHLEWSSLPVGGESTHCVLSGHRGLPSAKLFTNLDKLREGDTFLLRVLDEILTYEVDQILIVEPQDTAALEIAEGEDYCTLVTCNLRYCTPPAAGSRTPHRQYRGSQNCAGHRADAVQLELHAGGARRGDPHAADSVDLSLLLPRRRKK